jgi:hypothetical protein
MEQDEAFQDATEDNVSEGSAPSSNLSITELYDEIMESTLTLEETEQFKECLLNHLTKLRMNRVLGSS